MTTVAAALIWRGDKFLICQRPSNKARALMWEFVGGKLEPGETGQDALVRECMEELGVSIEVRGEYMRLVHEYPDMTIQLIVYNAEIAHGEITLYEHNDAKWIVPAEIPNYQFCPADRQVLERIMSDRV